MSYIAGTILAQLLDPLKWIAAFVVYRVSPPWWAIALASLLLSAAINLIAEALNPVGGSFELLFVPGAIACAILFTAAKLVRTRKSEGDPGQGSTAISERKCPFCAETIKAEALKCRYCASEVVPVTKRCNFCGEIANAPILPCSDFSRVQLIAGMDRIKSSACREALAKQEGLSESQP